MAQLEFEIQVHAPANLVAAFFVPQRMNYWYGAEMESCFEIQGGAADFQAGQKVRITGRLRGREVTLTAVIMRYEFARMLEWQFQDSYGVRGMQSWKLIPTLRGTRVLMSDSYRFPGAIGKIWDWIFMRHAVKQRDRDWLAHLKRLAERR